MLQVVSTNQNATQSPSVGIVTIVGSFNYGNRLQNYAMEQIWKSVGFAPTTLRCDNRDAYHAVRHAVGRLVRRSQDYSQAVPRESLVTPSRAKAFARFDSLMHIEWVEHPSISLAERFDIFSAGSDQCWNPSTSNPGWYYLSFAPRSKRIALCPGLGTSEVNDARARTLRRGLAGFDRLSVREEDGARLIKQVSGRDAVVLCDPTLMLDVNEWRALERPLNGAPTSSYAFCYLLGSATPERDELLSSLHAQGLDLVQISDRDDPSQLPAGPAEWLHLLDSAEMVVTDSFHASVFATLFGRPLVLVSREGGELMSGRFDTLIRKLELDVDASGFEFCGGKSLTPTVSTSDSLRYEREMFEGYLTAALADKGWNTCERMQRRDYR